MKFIALMLLLLTGSVVVQAQDFKCPTEVKYDRFKDRTTEVCTAFVLETPPLGLFVVTPNISYTGTKRAAPIKVSISIVSQRGSISDGILSPEYSTTKVLYLLTNRGRSEVLVRVLVPTGPRRGMIVEALGGDLEPDALKVLLDAEEVEGRVESKEFKFREPSLRAFQKALRELEPLLNLPKPPPATKPHKAKP